ncbi:MAG: YihY family inner membrane protein, partial [Betaproteobacteria bacterium]|nr:YihY family inner membrane protein [Betaproteobacteria bacterium]
MIVPQLQRFLTACRRFPWLTLFRTLHQRFREDRLGQTAGSLTFTTTIALVPLFTVALAVFTVFPMFGQFQNVLQRWLIESLVPDSISRQVLGYLTQFSSKASRLGVVGVLFLLVSAITLVFTIDRSLNAIWRVRTRRPWAQRVLLYWAAITLGPLLMAASVMMMSYVVSVSRGVVSAMPSQLHVLLDGLEFLLLIGGVSALYKYVPYVHVPWRHALLGGTLVTLVTELARRLLTLYLASMPAYSTIYGAFATLPILLIWIYTAWVIVLAGAVFVANLHSLLGGRLRQGDTPGWPFQLALETVQRLVLARDSRERGVSLEDLGHDLQVDPLDLERVLASLVDL